MTFRSRLLTAFGVVVLIPLLVFGFGIRRRCRGGSRVSTSAASLRSST